MESKIITGKIWTDLYDELVIRNGNDTDIDIENLFKYYEGKNVKITIEIIPEVDNDDSELIDFRLGYIIKNDEAIEYFGLNPWCVNEGADPDEKYSCTMNKARELGLI